MSWNRAALVPTDTKLESQLAQQADGARAYAPDSSGLLACAYLLHLHPDLERVGKYAYQLAEIHALVGDVIENGLGPVALILHVANLHVEAKLLGYLARTDHRVMLTSHGLLILLEV